uniref:Uncharacterized protein n=1 Tax=Salix viminalis TaxID=40686 RepID=A0A6N2LYU7_SALVM
MGRAPCCDKANVKRGAWSPAEDATLKSYLRLIVPLVVAGLLCLNKLCSRVRKVDCGLTPSYSSDPGQGSGYYSRLEMLKHLRDTKTKFLLKDLHDRLIKKGEYVIVEMKEKFGNLTMNIIVRMLAWKQYFGTDTNKDEEQNEEDNNEDTQCSVDGLNGSINEEEKDFIHVLLSNLDDDKIFYDDTVTTMSWETKMKLVFDCHNYLEIKKVMLAVIEFNDYAIVWWDQLLINRRRNREPSMDTLEEIKMLMRKRSTIPETPARTHYMFRGLIRSFEGFNQVRIERTIGVSRGDL